MYIINGFFIFNEVIIRLFILIDMKYIGKYVIEVVSKIFDF